MKKLITSVLAIALVSAMVGTVSATDIKQDDSNPSSASTSVTLSVAPTFTVTIPQTIELEKKITSDVVTYEGSGDISTDTVRLNNGSTIEVTMATDFEMISDELATMPYTVSVGTTAFTVSGGTVATFVTSETAQSKTLNYKADDPEFAGEYADTVTFTISVAEDITWGRDNK